MIDEQPPIITVQTEYLPDDMPDALVGKKYPVPTAYGSDTVCGETPVSVSVKDENGGELQITDGCVTPGSVGVYTITYTSADFYGNETVKRYSFNAVESIEKIRLNWVTEPEIYTAGDTIVVPDIAVSGGSGNIHELQIAIRYNGREIELPVSRILKLTEAGEITFTIVSARDYIGTETDGETLSFDIAVPEKPTLTVVGVPEAYIVGQTAYLPEYSAIDYRYLSTEAGYNSAVKVKVNGQQVDGKTFVVPNVQTVTLVFTTGDGDSVAEKTIIVPTVMPQKLADYFTSDTAVSTEITNEGVLFTTTAGNDINFINPVVFNSLNVGFNIAKTVRCYNGSKLTSKSFNLPTAINVTFTDYYDPNYVVKLRITSANDTQSNLQINGRGDKIKIRGSFKAAETELQNYRLLLGADGTLMDIRSSLSFRIGDFMNGEEFNGFPSGLVKISFGVEGKGSVSLLINQLGNQIFDYYSYEYGDGTMPMLWTEYPMESGVRLKGEQIVISAAKAYDVLNVYGTVTLRVVVPDGNGSQKLLYDGIVPEKTIVLDAEYYGNYSAEYTLRDESGNYGRVTYNFPVRDTVAPTITVNGTVNAEYKVGDQMVIPEIFVTSSLDISPVYYVMIYNKSTRYERVTGTSVTLKKGDFKLVIYAYDSDYNVAVKEYEFTVR